MKRSSILDVLLVLAVVISATALTAFIHNAPERCPQARPSSIEALFAPCLVANRNEIAPPRDIVRFDLPPPSLRRGETAVAAPPNPPVPLDVDATGTVKR
jgi:hypothetical protein